MILRILLLGAAFLPGLACGASRDDAARVGVRRVAMAAAHGATASVSIANSAKSTNTSGTSTSTGTAAAAGAPAADDVVADAGDDVVESTDTETKTASAANCREAYRTCMDEFCMLDENEGYRCACSSNINKSRDLINEIRSIQEEADRLYTEGVERENLGAKALLVFGQSEAAKKSRRASGTDSEEWLLGQDDGIGDALYEMASSFCAAELEACDSKAEMEKMLYQRQIVQDCKSFESYLADQKSNAQSNKRTAEAAVRQARLSMLDTTNKYNRGECLLAYRSCIADKGGCGVNFENCLNASLLGRRANACENVLDQCMAVKAGVLDDWKGESEMILADAAKYADKNARLTCMARIQMCLEDGCSTATNSACLTDVNVAAGICPVIDECEDMIPGIKTSVNDKLGYLRLQFCQNDVDKCLRDKCGENFTAPECLGQNTANIKAMCPQTMFPSCKGETQANIDVIFSSILLQMDYQMLQGCINYFSEQLGRACGTDMSCLPSDDKVMSLTEVPQDDTEIAELRQTVRNNSKNAVNKFFQQFEKDQTVAACASSQQPTTMDGKKRNSLGTNVFNTAKVIAEISAENRALRELESKIAELSRKQDVETARKNCENTYKVETPEEGKKNYSYIRSVSFEPSLRNCHVCRMQQVCETGGESKGAGAAKGVAGGLSAGASMGTMINAGWGTAIGGIVGAVGGGIMGAVASGEKDFCQEIESCEDINM